MPLDPFTLDPFTQTYQTIRAGLMGPGTLTSTLVKPGNFMDASDPKFQMYKTAMQAGDAPDVMMLMGSGKRMPFGKNSLITSFTQEYPFIVRHDSGLRIGLMNTLDFYMSIDLLRMGDDLGLPFVVDVNIERMTDDPFGLMEMKLGSIRYVNAFSINVEMQLSRQSLLNFTP